MSLYELNIVLNNGKNTTKYFHEGKCYIEGRKNSAYKLVFRNNSARRVEVVVSVDGLDVKDGKTASINSRGYVVNAWSNIEIPGWKINSQQAAQFKFRPQGDSQDSTYVEDLRRDGIAVDTSNQGVIGVMVFEEYQVPQYQYTTRSLLSPVAESYTKAVPYGSRGSSYDSDDVASRGIGISSSSGMTDWRDVAKGINYSHSLNAGQNSAGLSGKAYAQSQGVEVNSTNFSSDSYATKAVATASDASLGTGWGTEVEFKTHSTTFSRAHFSTPQDRIVVFYDTLNNLKKMGVVVDNKPIPRANPFPGSPHVYDSGCYVPTSKRR